MEIFLKSQRFWLQNHSEFQGTEPCEVTQVVYLPLPPTPHPHCAKSSLTLQSFFDSITTGRMQGYNLCVKVGAMKEIYQWVSTTFLCHADGQFRGGRDSTGIFGQGGSNFSCP